MVACEAKDGKRKGTRFLWRRASHPSQTTIRRRGCARATPCSCQTPPHPRDRAAAPRRAPRSHRGGAESSERKSGRCSRDLSEEKRAALDAAVESCAPARFGTKGLPLRGQSGFLQVIRIP